MASSVSMRICRLRTSQHGRAQDRPGAIKDQRRGQQQQKVRKVAAGAGGNLLEVADIEDGAEAHDVGPQKGGHAQAQQQVAGLRFGRGVFSAVFGGRVAKLAQCAPQCCREEDTAGST